MTKTVVLISGGNRGIGLEIAKALLEAAPSNLDTGSGAPYHVYIGSRDLQKGKAAAANLPVAHGNTVSVIQLDITSPESVANAVTTVKAESGRLDVLINNAGFNDATIADEAAKMRTVYETNVIGASRVTDAFKPLLLTPSTEGRQVKRIIHVTSSMGSVASRLDPKFEYYNQPYTAYRCSKAAMNMLAACHAYDYKDEGVKVHAFDPGWAATEFGGGDPAQSLKLGAVDPRVSGLSCRDIVEGKRDNESDLIVSINGNTYPW
ncbi:NAD(P)-binding protein [Xylariaceae sp. FL1651]|nr:NAD(P)-binding protein [Xylariaceae sp. FL1651]